MRPVLAHLRPTLWFRSLGLSLSCSLHLNKILSAPMLPVMRSQSLMITLCLSWPLVLLLCSSPSLSVSLCLCLSLSLSLSLPLLLLSRSPPQPFTSGLCLAALRGLHWQTNSALMPMGALQCRTPGCTLMQWGTWQGSTTLRSLHCWAWTRWVLGLYYAHSLPSHTVQSNSMAGCWLGTSSNCHPLPSASDPFAVASAPMGKPEFLPQALTYLDQGLRRSHYGDGMGGHGAGGQGSQPGQQPQQSVPLQLCNFACSVWRCW